MAMNAQFLGKTRPKLADGDVFRIVMPGDIELYGLVAVALIERMANSSFTWEKCILVHIFRPGFSPLEGQSRAVRDFLVPPVITNRLGFTRFGVWQRTGSLPAGYVYEGDDRFQVRKNGTYCDVWGQPVPQRDAVRRLTEIAPCVLPAWELMATSYVVTSVPMIDDMISDALGIPRAAVTPEDFR